MSNLQQNSTSQCNMNQTNQTYPMTNQFNQPNQNFNPMNDFNKVPNQPTYNPFPNQMYQNNQTNQPMNNYNQTKFLQSNSQNTMIKNDVIVYFINFIGQWF